MPQRLTHNERIQHAELAMGLLFVLKNDFAQEAEGRGPQAAIAYDTAENCHDAMAVILTIRQTLKAMQP